MKPKYCFVRIRTSRRQLIPGILASVLAFALAVKPTQAASSAWLSDAAGNWNVAGSWNATNGIPGSTTVDNTDVATFGVTLTAARAVTVDTTRFIGGITFSNTSAFGFTLSGGALFLNSGGVIQSSGAVGNHTDTISTPIQISGTSAATASFTSGATTAANGVILISGGVTGSATTGNTTTLTLNGTGTGANTVSGIIGNGSGGGSLAVTKSGAGTWALSGANTYSGGTTLSAGTLAISNANSLGSGSVTVSGTSRINASGGNTYSNNISVGTQTLTLQNPGATTSTATFSGVLSGSGTLSLPNSGTNGVQGILAFTNTANTFTGNVNLSAANSGDEFFSFNSIGDGGTFSFAKNGNRQGVIHTGSSNITFNTRTITVAASMINGSAAADRQGMDGSATGPVSSFANNGTGTVTFTQNMVIGAMAAGTYGVLGFGGSNTGNNTFSGVIADPAGTAKLAIGKYDAGKWILSGANTYEAMAIIARGTLEVASITTATTAQPLGINQAFQLGRGSDSGTLSFTGGASSTNKQVFIGSPINAATGTGGGTIASNGSGALTFTNATFNPLSTSYVNPGTGATTGVAPTVSRTLTLAGTNTDANTISGIIQNNAAGGAVALTKSGVGTWVLSGANSYTGLTTISGGVLRITNNTSLGTTAGGVTVASGSGLEIDGTGAAVTVGAEAISIAGGGVTLPTPNLGAIRNIAGNNTYGGTVTLTAQSRINSDSGTLLFNNATAITGTQNLVVGGAGNVTIFGAITTNTGFISKDGAGTLILSGNNTNTGGLTVAAGTVQLGNSGALNSTAGSENAVTFAASSTGTLALGGNNVVIRSLTSNATPGTPTVENSSATNATLTVGNSLNLVSSYAGIIRDGTGAGTLHSHTV